MEDFVAQVRRYAGDTLSPDEVQWVEKNWPKVKRVLQSHYVESASNRMLQREDKLREIMESQGLRFAGANIGQLPEETVAKLRRDPRFERLARLDKRERRRVFELTLQEAGLR